MHAVDARVPATIVTQIDLSFILQNDRWKISIATCAGKYIQIPCRRAIGVMLKQYQPVEIGYCGGSVKVRVMDTLIAEW